MELYFTTAAQGEGLTHYTTIKEKDLILADRGYGTKTGIFYVLDHSAEFVLRMRLNAFHLYMQNGETYDLIEELRVCEPRRILDLHLFLKREQEFVPVRICGIGKAEEAVQKSQYQIKKSNHARKPGSELQKIWSHYVVTVTSLPSEISAEKMLELYRMQ